MEIDTQETYNVRTGVFEGPLDLLLHLIKKNKMNIMDIKISEITSEYLYYLQDRTRVNPSREGDFLMTASTLIYIKSRSLLPKPEILQEEESPEDRLIHSLIEYDKIQKISQMLKDMEEETLLLWKREEIVEKFDTREYKLEEVSSFQLAEVFLNILKRKEGENFLYIDSKEYSIEKKWNEILALMAIDGFLDFFQYVATLKTIQDILVSFFCILEMIKRNVLIGVQKKLFGPISLWKTDKEKEKNE
ncbi:MAG: segregation and condensation protein [Acidobacteriota bacterium]|nr:segregation and condensation protein [Acidobacteriota bacterium]